MTDKLLEEAISQLEKEEIEQTISEIDKIIEIQDLQIKNSLYKKLEKVSGIKLVKRSFINVSRIAIVLLFILCTVCIVKPKVITAMLDLWIEISSVSTGHSVDITTKEVTEDTFWNDVQISIPAGYIYDRQKSKQIRNLNRISYISVDDSGSYITLTAYDINFWLSQDNENADYFNDNDKINDNKAVAITKNGISTIIILYEDLFIVEIESNLPFEDVLIIANSIKTK